jgi:hypothetical protein
MPTSRDVVAGQYRLEQPHHQELSIGTRRQQEEPH